MQIISILVQACVIRPTVSFDAVCFFSFFFSSPFRISRSEILMTLRGSLLSYYTSHDLPTSAKFTLLQCITLIARTIYSRLPVQSETVKCMCECAMVRMRKNKIDKTDTKACRPIYDVFTAPPRVQRYVIIIIITFSCNTPGRCAFVDDNIMRLLCSLRAAQCSKHVVCTQINTIVGGRKGEIPYDQKHLTRYCHADLRSFFIRSINIPVLQRCNQ